MTKDHYFSEEYKKMKQDEQLNRYQKQLVEDSERREKRNGELKN